MTDLSTMIAPKSDQLNSDDLISGPKTIKITKVRGCSEPDQPVAIHFEGDENKPYKPCKSMRRVFVFAWGANGNDYVGRSLTLYRDDRVMFGGIAVGGIRISHMSHIERDMTMALTATRAKRTPYTVKPLRTPEKGRQPARQGQTPATDDGFPGDDNASPTDGFDVLGWADELERLLPHQDDVDLMRADWSDHKAELQARDPARFKDLNQKIARRAADIAGGA